MWVRVGGLCLRKRAVGGAVAVLPSAGLQVGVLRVFVSYSHDSETHRQAVLELTQALRRAGIDAWLDRFEPWPAEGWPAWMRRQATEAGLVVCVCTAAYKRRFEAPGRATTRRPPRDGPTPPRGLVCHVLP